MNTEDVQVASVRRSFGVQSWSAREKISQARDPERGWKHLLSHVIRKALIIGIENQEKKK